MIQLWAEVYDPTYTTQVTDGDLLLVSARVERVLDGPGRVDVETPILHVDYTSRALGVLTAKRVLEIWYQENEHTTARRVTAMVIEDVSYVADSGGIRLTVRGSDVMALLMNYTTDLARIYENQTVQTIVTALAGLAGWTVSYDGVSGSITTRFDGVSVLKGIQTIAEETGYHLRLGSTFKTLEFGAFGSDSGYRVVKLEGDHPMPARDSNVIPLERISIKESNQEIINWIIPMGGGKGDSTLTLENSTRSSPYTIQSYAGPDGRTIYYLADSTSIATYGQIEKRVNFKKITPVGTSSTQIQRSANFLYDAAAEWLSRRTDPLTEIGVNVYQQRVNFDVGDKVRVEYVEMVNVGGTPVTLKSIDALYWVMGSRESYGDRGEQASLTLASIDRVATDAADIIVGQIDAIDVQDTGYQPSLNLYVWGPYQEPMDSSENAVVTFRIPDQTLDLFYVELRVTTVPFSSTAKSPAHRHMMMQYNNTATDQTTDFIYIVATDGAATGTDSVFLAANSTLENVDIYTYGAGGAQEYGIYKDTDYPDNLDIDVNGTQVANNLDSGGTGLTNYSIDITDEIVNKAGGFRADHTITFSCGGGQGEVRCQIIVQDAIIMGKAT